ncbi:hypothetical protein [Erysipelothrix sp. HDW6A]|uniref:hypothetical protein n=1 Tax=Erysipelothrix sp. HDW6A TaxID=2714928 RepID=UPI00351AFA48
MFQLNVYCMNKKIYSDDVSSLTIPTVDGMRTLLPNHMDTQIVLGKGHGYIKIDKQKLPFSMYNGIISYESNKCTLFVDAWVFDSSWQEDNRDLIQSMIASLSKPDQTAFERLIKE